MINNNFIQYYQDEKKKKKRKKAVSLFSRPTSNFKMTSDSILLILLQSLYNLPDFFYVFQNINVGPVGQRAVKYTDYISVEG